MNWNGLTPNSFWYDEHRLLYNADCRSMEELENESVQCVVTSPPYWGLRKYSGLPDLIWGGKEDCEHQWSKPIKRERIGWEATPEGQKQFKPAESNAYKSQSHFCSLCGAWKGAYGLEPTPEMYVQHTIEILREVRRVLRRDGVVFWNIGDTYSATRWSDARGTGAWSSDKKKEANPVIDRSGNNLPAKNLCLIPFRVAIAAQEDGWVIRSMIIWNKPNPMPESVRDRPTESHEYIIMMTKARPIGKLPIEISDNDRHWLAGVIDGEGCIRVAKFHNSYGAQILVGGMHKEFIERVKQITGVGSIREQPHTNGKTFYNWSASYLDAEAVIKSVYPLLIVKRPEAKVALNLKGDIDHAELFTLSGRIHQELNVDVSHIPEPKLDYPIRWIPEKYYWDAEAVREPQQESSLERYRAGGSFDKCGTPGLAYVNEKREHPHNFRAENLLAQTGRNLRSVWTFPTQPYPEAHFATYPEKLVEICVKAASKEGDIVLDPFAGSGTTLKVAAELNRRAIGYELSEQYCKLIVERNRQGVMG